MSGRSWCKNCTHWLAAMFEYPCRACFHLGRHVVPRPGELIGDYFTKQLVEIQHKEVR